MKRETTVNIPIYLGKLIIIQTDDFQPLEARFNLTDTSSCQAFCLRRKLKTGQNRYAVIFNNEVTGKIIAHECVHLVNYLFEDRGIKLDLVNDEPQAYLTDWFFGEIEKFVVIKPKK